VALLLEMQPADRGHVEFPPLEALARQAVTSDDSRVYGLAYHLCQRFPEQGSCPRLSAAQWARVDAGNAAPWLFLLDDASRGDDVALVDEALHRIGNAARFDARAFAPAAAIAARGGATPAELVAAQTLATATAGITAAFPAPLQALTRACSASALADANRRQACDAVAATLGERSDSRIVPTGGAAVGRRVGWPVERLAPIRAKSVALSERWTSDPWADSRSPGSFSCDSVRRLLDYFRDVGRVGEPQVARAWMAASEQRGAASLRIAREQEASRAAPATDNALRLSTAPHVPMAATAER
jgi:hypothetical protein